MLRLLIIGYVDYKLVQMAGFAGYNGSSIMLGVLIYLSYMFNVHWFPLFQYVKEVKNPEDIDD